MDLEGLRQQVLTPSGPPAAAPDAASLRPGAIDRSLEITCFCVNASFLKSQLELAGRGRCRGVMVSWCHGVVVSWCRGWRRENSSSRIVT